MINSKIVLDDSFDNFMWDDDDIAFIKPEHEKGKNKWIVRSSDGTKIAEVDSREYAFIVAKQHDFLPCSVH